MFKQPVTSQLTS